MVCLVNSLQRDQSHRFFSGDIREKLRLAFDMYDMNKNGKVNILFNQILLTLAWKCIQQKMFLIIVRIL